MTLTKWDLMATHGLRQYIWSLLQSELGWSLSNYHDPVKNVDYVPIVAAEQQPEMNQFEAPYLVYAYSKKMSGNLHVIEGEVAAFVVYAKTTTEINQVLNLLAAKFDRRDESAQNLNKWLKTSGLDQQYKNFDYKTMWVSGFQGPQPALETGGRRDGSITINITYTHYNTAAGGNGAEIRV